MATTATFSNQVNPDYVRNLPYDAHGKVRFAYFETVAAVAAGDVGSTIDLVDLPPGRVRVLPYMSRLTNTAFGAGAGINIGMLAYESRDSGAADPQAADPVALTPTQPIDVSVAGDSQAFDAALKFDFYSKSGVRVQATLTGAGIPVAAVIKGLIAYIYE